MKVNISGGNFKTFWRCVDMVWEMASKALRHLAMVFVCLAAAIAFAILTTIVFPLAVIDWMKGAEGEDTIL